MCAEYKNWLHKIRIPIFLAALVLLISAVPVRIPAEEKAASQTGSTEQAAAQTGSAERSAEPFRYEHDPMENPAAAEDIIVNPDAVYGYSPNPDSKRLGGYAEGFDWTDPAQVAAGREERRAYLEENKKLYRLIEEMLGQGANVEEIASMAAETAGEGDGNNKTDGSREGADDEEGGESGRYVVQKGDSLWEIAETKLGSGVRWNEIYEMNRSDIRDPGLIYPGQELLLPAA